VDEDELWHDVRTKYGQPKQPIRNLFYFISGGRNEEIGFTRTDRIRYELFRSDIKDDYYDDWFIYLDYSEKSKYLNCDECGNHLEQHLVECDFLLEGETKEIVISAHYAEKEWPVVIQEKALNQLLEKPFLGARPLHPKSAEEYVVLSTKNCLHRLPEKIVGREFCPKCKESIYCTKCQNVRSKCSLCEMRFSSTSATGKPDYHDRCSDTVSLENWNGDDFALVGDSSGLIVSGRVLEAMLKLKFYSFMYGPVATDLHDMDPKLYDRVKELRRDFDCFQD
jgi:hypothetical protein